MKGYCGINCHQCACFIATKEDDVLKKMEIAMKWSRLFQKTILPREIHCTGCQSMDQQFSYCENCKIKQKHEDASLKKSS